jgi:hypothetical protein
MKEERYSDRVLREIRSVENEVVLPFIKKRGDFDRVLGQNRLVEMGSLGGWVVIIVGWAIRYYLTNESAVIRRRSHSGEVMRLISRVIGYYLRWIAFPVSVLNFEGALSMVKGW